VPGAQRHTRRSEGFNWSLDENNLIPQNAMAKGCGRERDAPTRKNGDGDGGSPPVLGAGDWGAGGEA
jgi:hypothetical protein